ncbi:hypothetical protein RCL1_007130 [Eukaryota sp. TZLM3-RCL]
MNSNSSEVAHYGSDDYFLYKFCIKFNKTHLFCGVHETLVKDPVSPISCECGPFCRSCIEPVLNTPQRYCPDCSVPLQFESMPPPIDVECQSDLDHLLSLNVYPLTDVIGHVPSIKEEHKGHLNLDSSDSPIPVIWKRSSLSNGFHRHAFVSKQAASVMPGENINIVKCYGVTTNPEGIILEPSDCTLQERLDAGRPLTNQEKLSIMIDIAKGLRSVFYLYLTHSKLNTVNIELTGSGDSISAKISDFENTAANAATMRPQDIARLMSEPFFLAPEILTAKQGTKLASTPAADVFSLGVLFACLLEEEGSKKRNDAPQVIRSARMEINGKSLIEPQNTVFKSLLTAMLDTDPNRRPTLDYIITTLSKIQQDGGFSTSTLPPSCQIQPLPSNLSESQWNDFKRNSLDDMEKLATVIENLYYGTYPGARKPDNNAFVLYFNTALTNSLHHVKPVLNYYIGACYLGGFGVAFDGVRAVQFFEEGTKLKDKMSMLGLAVCHHRKFLRGCNCLAFQYYMGASDLHIIALHEVIQFYDYGLRDPSDGLEESSREKYKNLMTNQSFIDSCFNKSFVASDVVCNPFETLLVARFFQDGIGRAKNFSKAHIFYEKLENSLFGEGLYQRGIYALRGLVSQPNKQLTMQLFEDAIIAGSTTALGALGSLHLSCEKNLKKAFSLFSQGAARNDVYAIYHLAMYHLDYIPDGKSKSFKEAYRQVKRGATLAHPGSLRLFGLCHLRGIGIEKDLQDAELLLHQASRRRDYQAMFHLYELYLEKGDPMMASSFLRNAYDAGVPDAVYVNALSLEKQGELEAAYNEYRRNVTHSHVDSVRKVIEFMEKKKGGAVKNNSELAALKGYLPPSSGCTIL